MESRGFTPPHFKKNKAERLINGFSLKNMKNRAGFTLIDILVGSFLMLIVFIGIIGVFYLGTKVVYQSKARVEATAIAKGEIEKIRNLPYSSIGIEGGFPDGDLEAQTSIIRNQVKYQVNRRVDFVIDSLDGIAPPADECPNDYKKIEIKISWTGKFPSDIKLATDIMPGTLAQECEEIGGLLLISVFDSLGEMIAFPLIEIKDPETDTVLKSVSPDDGEHYFALEPGIYKIVISKSGYNSERTYGTDEIAIPERPHPNILEGDLTEMSFSIDKLSSFSVNTFTIIEEEPVILPLAQFHVQGEKIIGHNQDEDLVYEYSENHITDAEGHFNILGLEWDLYAFSVDSATGFNLTDTEPSPQPIDLLPDTNTVISLYLEAENSFFLLTQDLATQEPIFSAEARLYNTGLDYDESQFTNENGQTIFIPLEAATYNLEIQAPGYQGYAGIIPVSGDTTQTVSLERIE